MSVETWQSGIEQRIERIEKAVFNLAEPNAYSLLYDGWRDAQKGFPEIGKDVLIRVKVCQTYNIEQGKYLGNGEWINCWSSMKNKSIYPVTHWMPLPDPPTVI